MGMLCILPGDAESVRKCIELLILAFVRVFPGVVHSPPFFVKSSGSSAFRYGKPSWFHMYRGDGRRRL